MSCLDDIYCGKRILIGIRDYNQCNNPESKLFINSLPGMTLKNAANIASEEYQTGYNLLFEKIKLATQLVVNDFTSIIASNFDFNGILANREVHYFDQTKTVPKENKDRGLVLKRWRSELANIYIESIFVQSKNSGVAILQVIDGSITKSFELNLVANSKMQFDLNYRAKSEQVKILINDTDFEMYSGSMNASMVGCGSCNGSRNEDLYVVGWDGEKENTTYYGIGVSASVRCYEDNAICKLIERLYFPIWYRSGIEILNEKMHGNRINNIVSFNETKTEKLLEAFQKEYNKSKKDFATNSKTFLKSLTADCVTCNSMRHVQTTP